MRDGVKWTPNTSPIKPIGEGAYGVVCSAREVETNRKVAIKKIVNAFENVVDAKGRFGRLSCCATCGHGVIEIIDCVKPEGRNEFEDVYLMYDLMDTDLYQIIRSSQSLTDEHCQYFVYQILRGLKIRFTARRASPRFEAWKFAIERELRFKDL